jgi:superfamily I DNA/RNA helicase
LTSHFSKGKSFPFDFVVVDESQDISVAQLRFLSSLGIDRPNRLFFAGDLGQRIFQQPFSWKALGVDIRGRSRTLRINYRTSHQIRMQADRLLGPELSDVDGNLEERRGTISVFNGTAPSIQIFDDEQSEIGAVAKWLKDLQGENYQLHEIGIFVRSNSQLERARRAVKQAGLIAVELESNIEGKTGQISICVMHLAKGLEFRAVAVMACDDEIIPLQERIECVADDSDLEEVYNTERHLLYVACTRARDRLLVTGIEPASEFLDDLYKE